MSKLQEYGYELVKRNFTGGEIIPLIKQKHPGGLNSVLTFVNSLNKHETESFVDDLNRCLDLHGNVDEGFFSDGIGDRDVLYQYPNVNIDDILIVPMVDMKAILIEWLNFAF